MAAKGLGKRINSRDCTQLDLHPLSASSVCPPHRPRLIVGWLAGLSALFLHASAYAAEGMRSSYNPPPAVSSGNLMQIIFSLFMVLAAIVLVAWLLKRMNMAQQGSGNLLKVRGGVTIGQRERIVLVEIENTWLVIGMGPGQIRTLHTLQKPESADATPSVPETQPHESQFSHLLSSLLNRHKQDVKTQ